MGFLKNITKSDGSNYKFQFLLASILIHYYSEVIYYYPQLYTGKEKLIKDIRLEILIKKELEKHGHKGPITIQDLETIDNLAIGSFRHVRDLEGIQYLSNLKRLIVEIEGITNLNSIAELPNLEILMIHGGNSNELSFLNNLKSLDWLELNYVEFDDNSKIACPPKLHILSIHGAELNNLSFLPNTPSVKIFMMSFGELDSIDGIESLPNLEELAFYKMKIHNLSKRHMQKLKSLEEVYISKSDFSGIDMSDAFNGIEIEKKYNNALLKVFGNEYYIDISLSGKFNDTSPTKDGVHFSGTFEINNNNVLKSYNEAGELWLWGDLLDKKYRASIIYHIPQQEFPEQVKASFTNDLEEFYVDAKEDFGFKIFYPATKN